MSVKTIVGALIIALKINRKEKELTHGYSAYRGSRLSAPSILAIFGDSALESNAYANENANAFYLSGA